MMSISEVMGRLSKYYFGPPNPNSVRPPVVMIRLAHRNSQPVIEIYLDGEQWLQLRKHAYIPHRVDSYKIVPIRRDVEIIRRDRQNAC